MTIIRTQPSNSDNENDDNTAECSFGTSSSDCLELSTIGIQNSDRSILTPKFHPGVVFINSRELHFVDKQHATHSNIERCSDNIDQYQKAKLCCKRSSQWFTRDHP